MLLATMCRSLSAAVRACSSCGWRLSSSSAAAAPYAPAGLSLRSAEWPHRPLRCTHCTHTHTHTHTHTYDAQRGSISLHRLRSDCHTTPPHTPLATALSSTHTHTLAHTAAAHSEHTAATPLLTFRLAISIEPCVRAAAADAFPARSLPHVLRTALASLCLTFYPTPPHLLIRVHSSHCTPRINLLSPACSLFAPLPAAAVIDSRLPVPTALSCLSSRVFRLLVFHVS